MRFYLNANNMPVLKKHFLNFLLAVVLFTRAYAQQDTIEFTFKNYGIHAENEISNSEHLSDFFERLYQLQKGTSQQVNIIQIGDSHIQADLFSGTVRQNIQKDFGNAGRGLIVPGKVARTNEAYNIVTSSPFRWDAKRCIFPDQPLPIGVGGITISIQEPNANLRIKTINYSSMDYSFDRVTLFYQKDLTSYNFVIRDSAQQDLAFIGPFTFEPFPNSSKVVLPKKRNEIIIQALPPNPNQIQATIFGISLENGKNGVIYHAIGVNGAKYRHYNDAKYFAEQTAPLYPDLFILSLGTNEALDYPYIDPQLSNHIDKLIESLKANNPGVKFLLTVPPDSYRKKTRRNPGIERVRDVIIGYANQHQLAYWDLYGAAGGKHSADVYRKNKLLQPDGVHFTRDGYELQGNLLYDALMKGYNTYVSYRHP